MSLENAIKGGSLELQSKGLKIGGVLTMGGNINMAGYTLADAYQVNVQELQNRTGTVRVLRPGSTLLADVPIRGYQPITIQPSVDPAANTKLFIIKNAAGTIKHSVDLEGDAEFRDVLPVTHNQGVVGNASKKFQSSNMQGDMAAENHATFYALGRNSVAQGHYIDELILYRSKVDSAVKATPEEGDLKWDAAAHKLQIYNGTAWETVTSS